MMKKKIAVALSACMLFSLSTALACEESAWTADDDIRVIVSHRSQWENLPEAASDAKGFAITDLDHNGRLEILVSQSGGTGDYTYTNVFEVNKTHDGLNVCRNAKFSDDSEPDIMRVDALPINVYYDQSKNQYWYYCFDNLRDGPAHLVVRHYGVSLQNGRMQSKLIGTNDIKFTEIQHEPVQTYYDGKGKKTSADRYRNDLENETFAGMTKSKVNIGWLIYNWQDDYDNWYQKDDATLRSMFKESYQIFTGEKDAFG